MRNVGKGRPRVLVPGKSGAWNNRAGEFKGRGLNYGFKLRKIDSALEDCRLSDKKAKPKFIRIKLSGV